MHNWWLAAVPIIAGGVGYLARRWLEKGRKAEALRRRLDALTLLRGMRRERVTFEDLEDVEREAVSGSETKPDI